MRIPNYQQYKISEDFVNFLANPVINESDDKESVISEILQRLQKDLKFNYGLVFTFGVGVRLMMPIVDNLIKNGNIKVELNVENLVLISLAALTITYLEESKNKSGDAEVPCSCKEVKSDCKVCGGSGMIKSIVTKQDARTLLEELKLKGIGNGIVQKLVECFKFFGKIFKPLFTHSAKIINGLIDMLAYTSILLPAMNAILSVIGKYELTMDTLQGNALAMGLGISSFLAKYGFDYLATKFASKLGLNSRDLDKPQITTIVDTEDDNLQGNKLIKEQ